MEIGIVFVLAMLFAMIYYGIEAISKGVKNFQWPEKEHKEMYQVCPCCAKRIKVTSNFCRYCGKDLSKYRTTYSSKSGKDISDYGINEIKSSGRFTSAERAAEYRRRGKSPSGVIDGVYNDSYRGNDSYNDADRDWDADA